MDAGATHIADYSNNSWVFAKVAAPAPHGALTAGCLLKVSDSVIPWSQVHGPLS